MLISLKLLQDIVNYLETRPFKEVAAFLAQVQAEYQTSQQPVADAPKPE